MAERREAGIRATPSRSDTPRHRARRWQRFSVALAACALAVTAAGCQDLPPGMEKADAAPDLYSLECGAGVSEADYAVEAFVLEGVRVNNTEVQCALVAPNTGWSADTVIGHTWEKALSDASNTGPGVVMQVDMGDGDRRSTAVYNGQTKKLILVVVTQRTGDNVLVDWNASVEATKHPTARQRAFTTEHA